MSSLYALYWHYLFNRCMIIKHWAKIMSNCQIEVKFETATIYIQPSTYGLVINAINSYSWNLTRVNNFWSTSPTNVILSSLISEFWQRIQIQGARCRYENISRHIFYTRHIVTTSSTEPYSLMKIFPTVIKIEGIVALTIEGR